MMNFIKEIDRIIRLEDATLFQPELTGIVESDIDEWSLMIDNALAEIGTGKLEKVVLARTIELNFDGEISPSLVMENLSNQQSNSFLFGIEHGQVAFVGASPERLILKNGHNISTACVAGTIGRGESEYSDKMLENELLNDSKNVNEHRFVVNYIRTVLENKCLKLDIPSEPQILKNKNVQHLYTPVNGIALPEKSILDFVSDLHPTPAMGGMPHPLALQKIKALENFNRGFYASPLGWMDQFGNG